MTSKPAYDPVRRSSRATSMRWLLLLAVILASAAQADKRSMQKEEGLQLGVTIMNGRESNFKQPSLFKKMQKFSDLFLS